MGPRQDWLDQVRAAAVLLQPFGLILAVALALAPPGAAELAAADPIVAGIARTVGVPAVVALAVGVGITWTIRWRPSTEATRDALGAAGAALVVVLVGLAALRLALGPTLPGFVPLEESAKPGLALGLAAGVVEEAAFRLVVLPFAVSAAIRVLPPRPAYVAAVIFTGVAFAVAHEVGPEARGFSAAHFTTRLLVPGALMSAAALWPGPAFVVTLHCAAHLLLPTLFD